MAKTIKTRPSSLERAEDCPASTAAESVYPWTDTPAAKRGRIMHDAMALLVKTGADAWDAIYANPEISKDDAAILKDCLELGQALLPEDDDVKVYTEMNLDTSFLELTGGKADVVFISHKFKGAVIIDWKFGTGPVDDPRDNRQQQAYAAALVKEMRNHGLELESVESAIIQPSSWREDDKMRQHVFDIEELRARAKEIKQIALKAQDPDAQYNATDRACKFCAHKANCDAYANWSGIKAEAKAERKKQELATVTAGTPVIVEPEEKMETPVVVVSAEIVAQAEQKKEFAMTIKVTDAATAEVAGSVSKEIRTLRNLIDKNREAVKKPFLNLGRMIDAAAKRAMGPLDDAAGYLDGQVSAFVKAEAEKARLAREREERRLREEEARRQSAEQERIRQEQAAQEAARKAVEAQEKAARARTAAAREKAEKAAAEAMRQEAEALAAAEAEAVKQREAEMAAATQAMLATPQEPQKITGYRETEKVTWEIPDVVAVPADLARLILVPDQKTVDALIKAGKIKDTAEWIKITRTTTAQRSR